MIKSGFGNPSMHYWDFQDIVDEIHPNKALRFLWEATDDRILGKDNTQKLDEPSELLTSFVNDVKRY